jgi:hypothetical protein
MKAGEAAVEASPMALLMPAGGPTEDPTSNFYEFVSSPDKTHEHEKRDDIDPEQQPTLHDFFALPYFMGSLHEPSSGRLHKKCPISWLWVYTVFKPSPRSHLAGSSQSGSPQPCLAF